MRNHVKIGQFCKFMARMARMARLSATPLLSSPLSSMPQDPEYMQKRENKVSYPNF